MPLTDELAEALTPEKGEASSIGGTLGGEMHVGLAAGERQAVLMRIAKVRACRWLNTTFPPFGA